MPRSPSVAPLLAPFAALLVACASAPTTEPTPLLNRPGHWFARSGEAVRLQPRAGGAIELRLVPSDSLLALVLRDTPDTAAAPRAIVRMAPVVLRRVADDLDSLLMHNLPADSAQMVRGVHIEDQAGELALALVRLQRRTGRAMPHDSIALEARASGGPLVLPLTHEELADLGTLLRSYGAYLSLLPATRPADGNRPYFAFELERPITPARGGCVPHYPVTLRERGVTGEAIVEFVVDTAGRVEPGSFRVLRTTHDGFAEAVRVAMPCTRFVPARLGGRPVRQVVQQPFSFDIARDR